MNEENEYYSSPDNENGYSSNNNSSNRGNPDSYYTQNYNDYNTYRNYSRTQNADYVEVDTNDYDQVEKVKLNLGVKSLVFSIIGIIFSSCWGFGIVLAIISINLRNQVRKLNDGENTGFTKASFVLCIFTFIFSAIAVICILLSFALPFIFSAMEQFSS